MKPSIGEPLAALAARCASLEAQVASLQRQVATLLPALSGTLNSAVASLSGTVVLVSGSAATGDLALSSSLASRITQNSSSLASLSATVNLRDPFYTIEAFDDYFFSLASNAASAGASTALSSIGADNQGLLVMSVSTSGSTCSSRNTLGGFVTPSAGGTTKVYHDCVLGVNDLSNGTNNDRIEVGLGDQTVIPIFNGVFWENDRSVHGNNNWWFVTVLGGTRTQHDSGVASDTSFHRFSFEMAAQGDAVTGTIDGGSQVIHTTNIPTNNSLTPSVLLAKTLGNSSMAVYVDLQRTRAVRTSGSR